MPSNKKKTVEKLQNAVHEAQNNLGKAYRNLYVKGLKVNIYNGFYDRAYRYTVVEYRGWMASSGLGDARYVVEVKDSRGHRKFVSASDKRMTLHIQLN